MCLRKDHKYNSPSAAISAVVGTQHAASPEDELLGLCSGKFETQRDTQELTGFVSDTTSSSQVMQEILGLAKPPPPRHTRDRISQLVAGLGSLVSEDTQDGIVGLCSGVFPTQSASIAVASRHQTSSQMKRGSRFRTSDGRSEDHSSSDSDGEMAEEGMEGVTRSRVRRQLLLAGSHADRENDDEDMPQLSKKKRRPRPKPTRRCSVTSVSWL